MDSITGKRKLVDPIYYKDKEHKNSLNKYLKNITRLILKAK